MPISQDDAIQLFADGFTREELLELTNATFRDGTPQLIDIDTEGWQRTRLARRTLVAGLRKTFIDREKKKSGHKPSEGSISEYVTKRITGIRSKLNVKYGSDTDTTFVFLREEYSRSFGGKTNYESARANREADKKSRYKN